MAGLDSALRLSLDKRLFSRNTALAVEEVKGDEGIVRAEEVKGNQIVEEEEEKKFDELRVEEGKEDTLEEVKVEQAVAEMQPRPASKPPTEFSYLEMTELAQICSLDAEAIPVDHFCNLLDMIVLLLKGMGRIMSIAFEDVANNSSKIRANRTFLVEKFDLNSNVTLNACIDEEIARGLLKSGRQSYPEYDNPTARILVPMWWLTMFLTRLLENLITNEDMSMVAACKDAYQVGFGKNHGWLIRQGAMLAMNAVGKKSEFVARLGV